MENNSERGIKIFPNPTTGEFYIQSGPENIDVLKVIDIHGKTVIAKNNLEGSFITIDLSSYPNGIYSILIINQNTTLVTRIILNN